MPDSFSAFEKNGWVGKDFGNNTLDPNKYNTAYLENGDKKMMISIENFGTDVLPMSKCHVGKIRIDSYNKKNGTTISIAKGIAIGSTYEEVIAAKSSAVGVELRKDNQVLRTQIENYSDKGETLKNCFATYVEYYNNGAVIPIELPKGITEKYLNKCKPCPEASFSP